MPQQTSLTIFVAAATLLGLAGLALIHVRGRAAFTGNHMPWYAGFEGVVLLGIGAALGLPAVLLTVMVPLLMLFTYLQLRRLQYCDACQRTVPRLRPLSEPEFCVRCGGSLRQ
jgi:hypothetical protein